MKALTSWSEQLAAWAIPQPVLDAADESPWVLPHQVFVRRADRRLRAPAGPAYEAVAAALATPGTVLDVGAGAGAASLPLVGRVAVTELTAVDTDEEMLAAYAERAERLGVPARLVRGRWPDVAGEAGIADVVVCAHVVYNVRDLAPFVAALTAAARRDVVVELTATHPLTSLNELWLRFNGVARPTGPTAYDCIAALGDVGLHPRVSRWSRPAEAEFPTFDEMVDVTRRRLCLPRSAAPAVADALREQGIDPDQPQDLGSSGRDLVTLAWSGTADAAAPGQAPR